jgi:predicted alpha/beta-fold hydrolase
VPLPDEKEALILDIAFPDGAIENDNIYLVVHGINGHSNEGYVLDFANQQIRSGNIVAVMVTRGLMDSPVLGQNLLHFARTSDLAATARALKSAITKMKGRSMDDSDDRPMLTGIGYSMGAITLANYVARSGKDCALDAAIGFSGALDTREQVTFKRSASLWQPFIAKAMRDTMVNKYMKQIENKFDHDQYNEMMRAESLIDLDRSFFAPYNNYNGLDDYYSNT